MTFHHIGCVVKNISKSIQSYQTLLGNDILISPTYDISKQKAKVCFIGLTDNSFIELVEPYTDNAFLNRILTTRRGNYYHTAYKVTDFDMEIQRLVDNRYKKLDVFESEAFNMKRCIFLMNPELHLIELIEE